MSHDFIVLTLAHLNGSVLAMRPVRQQAMPGYGRVFMWTCDSDILWQVDAIFLKLYNAGDIINAYSYIELLDVFMFSLFFPRGCSFVHELFCLIRRCDKFEDEELPEA